MARDLLNNLYCPRGLSPTRATDNTLLATQIIDRANYDSVLFVIQTGTLADADATFSVVLQHGNAADLSDATNVPASEMIGTAAGASFNFADDDRTLKVGYIGTKRYVRLNIVPANNAGNADIAVLPILGHPRVGPKSTQKV